MNIIKPDRGEVMIDGKLSSEETKNILGYMPEERGLYRKNKLLNVIVYFGTLKGLTPLQARGRALPLLEQFQLTSYANRKIEELSKGNQQKVQFIISILHDPPILVLDELFSGLDPINQEMMKDILLSLKRDNRAIVFSTHQMDQAEKLCDDLCLINKGKMILNGAPLAIKERYGKNTVCIEFIGDLKDGLNMHGINRSNVYGSYAEVELDPSVSSNEFLSEVMKHVEVRKFERVEPSLHSIFIDVVGGVEESEAQKEIQHPAKKPVLISKDKRVRKALFMFIVSIFITVIVSVVIFQKPNPSWQTPLILLIAVAGTLIKYIRVRRTVALELQRSQTKEVNNEK